MKKLLALILALAMVLSLAACGSSSSSDDSSSSSSDDTSTTETTDDASATTTGTEISACIASEPETLDPTLVSSVDGNTYVQHMFEGLMKYVTTDSLAGDDEDCVLLEVDYGQAESYEVSDDGLTYTFYLRDDIYWSNGDEVTAYDFVYSWQRLVDTATAADYGYLLDGIVVNATEIQSGELDASELGVEALDDKTFVVYLETQCPYFLDLCAFSTLVPLNQDAVEASDNWAGDPETMVTNGAYVLSSWTHDSVITMVKSDSYYNADAVTMETINWYLMDSETTYLSSYQSGELDFVEALSGENITTMQASGDCYIVDNISSYYLYLNCETITDWRVRAAIVLAIDRQNIIDTIAMGGQTQSTGIVAGGITTYDGGDWIEYTGTPLYAYLADTYPDYDLTTYTGRTELAQALLAEAEADGYDVTATLDYEYNTSDTHKAIAEAVQADLSSVLGMSATLNNSEWQTYTTNLSSGDFDLARLGWSADYDDPITYLELFTDGNTYNYGNWSGDTCTEFTNLITEIKSMGDSAERDELMAEAEYLLFSEDGFTVCPIYNYTQNYCLTDGYSNIGWNPLGFFIFTYTTQS